MQVLKCFLPSFTVMWFLLYMYMYIPKSHKLKNTKNTYKQTMWLLSNLKGPNLLASNYVNYCHHFWKYFLLQIVFILDLFYWILQVLFQFFFYHKHSWVVSEVTFYFILQFLYLFSLFFFVRYKSILTPIHLVLGYL